MITVSLCMIVKNEEHTLPICLHSAQMIADEIIIVDTGSLDNTKAVASTFTPHVFDFEWINDFSAARNFAFSKASQEYILWMDADDILLDEDAQKFQTLKQVLSADTDVVMMRYTTARDEQGKPLFTYFRERLVKRARGFLWHEPVHEYIALGGKIIESDIAITHNKPRDTISSDRNLRIYEALLARDGSLSPRGQYYYARELHDHGRTQDAIAAFTLFLEGGRGWAEDNIASCVALGKLYRQQLQPDLALPALFRSFLYDTPRAETCCHIGYCMKDKLNYPLAAYWFEQALHAPSPASSWGFTQPEYAGYIPAMELAVCYDILNDVEKADAFNEQAALFNPDSAAVASNRAYFRNKLQL